MSGHVTFMTIHDREDYTPEQRAKIIAGYPEDERDARAMGIPSFGDGRVFPYDEARIKCDAFPIPKHWARLNALDFGGMDHPFGAVGAAWDRDADCVYFTHAYRYKGRDSIPPIHAAAIKPWGLWVPTAWPHDGYQHDKGSGDQLADQYRAHGLNMLAEHATHAEGGNGVEAGITEMQTRMTTARLKVFSTLTEWFEEFRMYHRLKGLIVKERDDLMSASRYLIMMLRFAETEPNNSVWTPPGAALGQGGWLAS
jgi:hypothetical protein